MQKDGLYSSYQNHSGPGDNVLNKFVNNNINNYTQVYADIAPKNINKIVVGILNDLRDYKVDEAKSKLATLQLIDQLDEESLAIIETLSIHCDLIDNQNIDNALSIINNYLANHQSHLIRDLCLSASIKLCCKKNKNQEAMERFNNETSPGSFAKNAYFNFLADAKELKNIFDRDKFKLKENELEGIVYGALRLNNGDLAFEVADFLNNNFQSYNSHFLLLFSRAVRLNPVMTTVHYWLCNPDQRREILDLASEIIQLFDESENKDFRIFNIATPIIYFLRGEHEKLFALCEKNINEVAKVNELVASHIDSNYLKEDKEDPNYNLSKASKDETYKNELLNNLLARKEITSSESYILVNLASPSQLGKWLESDGVIIDENDIEKDFSTLSLKISATASPNKFLDSQHIKRDFDLLMDKLVTKNAQCNPEYILWIAKKLLSVSLAYEASRLLGLLIDVKNDFWNSPFIDTYIHCLHQGQQYLQLSLFLDKVEKSTWNSNTFITKAIITSFNGNLIAAAKIMEEGISCNKLDLLLWRNLINLNITLKKTNLEGIFNQIPEDLFKTPTELGFEILVLMAKNNLFNKAEGIILSWFIENPNETATYLSDFHFSLSIKDPRLNIENNKKLQFSEVIGDCLGGITYKSDNKQITKLIIKNLQSNHQILLGSASPIASFLETLNIGEKKLFSMDTIEVIERTSPYETAVKLATKLREELNDGRDPFYSFTVPNDPDGMIQVFTDKLSSMKSPNYDDIYKDPKIPILFKSYFINENSTELIEKAIYQFTNNKFVKHDLAANLGDESSKDVILDIYTICYLSITQLSKNIECSQLNIKITNETKCCLENWIIEIESGKYLRAGISDLGKVSTKSSEYMLRNFGDMINEIKHIIKIADIVHPELINVPNELLIYKDFIDQVTYSTVLASLSLNISWLCIDQAFGYILQKLGLGFKLYNPFILFTNLGNKLDFKSKKSGLQLHALDCIPYAATLNDIYLLSRSQDDFSYLFLVKMLNKYPQAIANDFIKYVNFLIEIIANFILNGYLQRKFSLKNPRRNFKLNNPFSFGVDDVFYACCNNLLKYPSGLSSEEKIAFFLVKIVKRYENIPEVIEWFKIAASLFVSGHFMSAKEINNKISQFALDDKLD